MSPLPAGRAFTARAGCPIRHAPSHFGGVLARVATLTVIRSLVLQSDFGTSDGAVAAMVGVAVGVDPNIRIFDLTHHIPPFDVWEASVRLLQTVEYWPAGTVFVSVVDPGVGSDRKSAVARTARGDFIVTPDNGTLTQLLHRAPIVEVREIDERVNRLPNSGESYTFHGRDIYAFTAARLAAGVMTYEEVGPTYPVTDIVEFDIAPAAREADDLVGTIDAHDVRYGSIWTNIPRELLLELGVTHGDRLEIEVTDRGQLVHSNSLRYSRSFADVSVGRGLAYINSLDNLAFAINRGNYAAAFGLERGPEWAVRVRLYRSAAAR